jgi:hypothetical protein
MKLGHALMVTLMVASIGAGCGSDDNSDSAGDTPESAAASELTTPLGAPVTEPDSAAVADTAVADTAAADSAAGDVAGDVAEFGENGGIEFTISGGHDESGKFVWIPVASSFAPGWWSMSFTEASADGAAVFTLSLDPANTNFSFGDGEVTIFGAAPQCSFDIDHQDSSGASGSLDCTGLAALTGTGMVGDVNVSATFDANM